MSFEGQFLVYFSLGFGIGLAGIICLGRWLKNRFQIEPTQPTIPVEKNKNPVWFWGLSAFLIFVWGVSLYLGGKLVFAYPQLTYWSAQGGGWIEYPIEIEFNVPVNLAQLKLNVAPETRGHWDFKRYFGFLPWGRKIAFYPDYSFPPGQRVMIYLAEIMNPAYSQLGNEALVDFELPPVPAVVKTIPLAGQKDVLPETELVIELAGEDGGSVYWQADLVPAVEGGLKIERRSARELILKPAQPLAQNTNYELKLSQTPLVQDLNTGQWEVAGLKELTHQFDFQMVHSPLIASFAPTGTGVLATAAIQIEFDEPMDTQLVGKRFKLEPAVTGGLRWDEMGRVLTFQPASLTKETVYQVSVAPPIVSAAGGITEEGLAFDFETVGPVKLVTSLPGQDQLDFAVTSPLVFEFDQFVDQLSAEASFSIQPAVEGEFSWEGKKLILTPRQSLSFATDYTWSFAPGIGTSEGLPSRDKFGGQFTTAPQRFVLDVPLIFQSEAYTCNLAALRMLLAYRGVEVSEKSLKMAVGWAGWRGSGNPHQGLVGNYGTYWEPIQQAASQYRPATIHENWNLTALLTEVQNGNPVMVWAQNKWSTPTDISWTADDGNYIYAVSGMHSVVVRGFVGTVENPTQIIFNDPWRPWRGLRTVPTATFLNSWGYFNVGMVVY